MAKFTLTIETNDAAELADITAAIADEQAAAHAHEQTGISDNSEPKQAQADAVRPTPAKRGRSAKASSAKDAAQTDVGLVGNEAASTPSTIASHFDLAAEVAEKDVAKIDVEGAGIEPVSAAECKLALNAAMDRKHDPATIQKALIDKFGAGSIGRIDESRYGDVKAYLDSLK